ncbi:MAG: hypothetical protein SFV24_11185 [Gemmatimonadales bacterium]|nr:hypothetical protein [Gemmatimonadales bacterium]
MSKVQAIVRAPRTVRLWRAARVVALAALVGLLAMLWLAPAAGLAVVWGAAIPVVATSLFVTPVLWRGVCPLATLNEVGNRFGRPVYPGPEVQWWLGVAGLILFHVLVPGRLAIFNHSGAWVAGAALGIGVLALLLGARFSVRSAFCNALCPILPIERLYGQAPLLDLERGRCGACTVCTPRGCLDLSGTKNVAQLMGPGRRTDAWLLTPFGLFSAALPGFIVGYFLAPNDPGAGLAPWGWTLLGSATSAVAVGILVRLTRAAAARALPIIAWASGTAYFVFTGPAIARLWGWPSGVGVGIAVGGVLFVAAWAVRGIRLAPRGTMLPDR